MHSNRFGIILVNFYVEFLFAVFVVQTFNSDSSDPTQPMSFPNYSDPMVANWSTGHDSVTLTPTIFDSAVLGKNNSLVMRMRQKNSE